MFQMGGLSWNHQPVEVWKMMFLFQTIDFQVPAISFPLGHICNLEILEILDPPPASGPGVRTQAFLPGYGPKYGGMPARLGGGW